MRTRALRFANVAVLSVRVETATPQRTRQGVGHHHRTMPASGATDANRHVRLPFSLVERQEIREQIRETPQCLLYFRVLPEILHDAPVVTRQTLQFRHEVWIGQMSHVKQSLQIARGAILVTKTQDLHAHRRALAIRTESREQKTPERVNRVI